MTGFRVQFLSTVVWLVWGSGLPAADRVEFNRDVRPILSDKCFFCHGPDRNHREGNLRLDTREGLLGGNGHEAVVVAASISESQLYRRITSHDPDQRMPPAESGKELTAEEIATLQRWIEQGADWQGHWAFEPIDWPVPPAASQGGFSRNPIDAFILQGLEEQGLAPSPEADRRTLLRRLSLDLTGLPPTVAEVEAFAGDTSEAAYAAAVDRLLQSPHYGERMAMWWLDLVRYADSVGYHGDQPMSVSPYRDYVINAFNANKRFDVFTREQLAGDLLPEATLEHQVASGYNRLGMMSAEGGVQPKEYLAKYIAERVRNVGGVWLGLTTGCCECHDHKYDPLSIHDFYSLEAFFADIEEVGLYSGAESSGAWGPRVQVPTLEESRRLAELDAQISALQTRLDTQTPELDAAQAAWEAGLTPWEVLRPHSLTSAGGAELQLLDDGSVLAAGTNSTQDLYTLGFTDLPDGVTALRLEALPDDSLPQRGPGRAGNGNFVLSEIVIRSRPAGGGEESSVAIATAEATYEQTGAADGNPYGKWAIAAAIDGDAQGKVWGWAVMEQVGRPQAAVFQLASAIPGGAGSAATIELHQNHDNGGHNLGRFRLLATSAPLPASLGAVPPPAIAELLRVPAGERTSDQQAQLAAHYRSIAPQLQPVREELARVQGERQALDASIVITLVTRTVAPRTIRVLKRGNWMDDSGEVVSPAFPEILRGEFVATDRRLTRLDLAEWLTARGNPLTARVFVNRLWKLFFGAGLSRSLDDFGAQGDWPSHPELLDWLAREFIESGWDVKHLVRLIVMSGTYRQSSVETDLHRERDPRNRWLSRQASFRLDAEVVRDVALDVSGLLVDSVGGRSVKPYQPPGYWAYLNFPQREWENGRGQDLYRRGLYTHWQRQYLHPSLAAFDAPSREECVADRPRSNTPLQTLVLLNDATYVEAARAFAARIVQEGGETFESRMDWAFRAAVARPSTPEEQEILRSLWSAQQQRLVATPERAAQLFSNGAAPAAEGIDPVELAAWTHVARTLLLLHETITRR